MAYPACIQGSQRWLDCREARLTQCYPYVVKETLRKMNGGIHAEVNTKSELRDTKSIKTARDQLSILPSYCINPQSEDGTNE